MTTDLLLAELSRLDVVLRIEGERLAFDAPVGVLSVELKARIRADRAGLMVALAEPTVPAVIAEPIVIAEPTEPTVPAVIEATVIDRVPLVDVWDESIELVDPDSVPTCLSCGRSCDVMTLAGCWKCSRCDPEADERRRRTMRLLSFADRHRRRLVRGAR